MTKPTISIILTTDMSHASQQAAAHDTHFESRRENKGKSKKKTVTRLIKIIAI
jgi:hypothetical protein